MTRKQKNDQALDAYLTRCQSNADLLGELTNFLTKELANGRSPEECRAEVARRWPGTRYATYLAAFNAAENFINQH